MLTFNIQTDHECGVAALQVYDGSKAGWREFDTCKPVNAYGQTKREAELLIQVSSYIAL